MELSEKKRALRVGLCILWGLLIFLGSLACLSARWYRATYSDIGFEAVLYTALNEVQATAGGLVWAYISSALLPALGIALLACLGLTWISSRVLRWSAKKKFAFLLVEVGGTVAALTASAVLLVQGADEFGISDWLDMRRQQTTLYQEEYVAPTGVNVVFEGAKRNLIYIYLESMENTFYSVEQGGVMPENVIPGLYQLAAENVNFSNTDEVGGGLDTIAAGWTVGAMTAQSSGLPLKSYFTEDDLNSFGEHHPILPGATMLGDILHDNGYYQTLMVGSDSNFGGRRGLYLGHGTNHIYDIATASGDGIIPEGYRVWWGFEDKYLFSYAKQELLKIAQQEQPFAFTMLTADTHHVGGYLCDLCQNQYAEQYENVFACSDRQVCAFIDWLRQQNFYENTTIVISGDHTSMDHGYMARTVPEGYQRRVYNCILNPVVEPAHTKNREFTTMDMFSTTLAAMGATVKEDRLGLGTNLFSGTPTILERMGLELWEEEISKTSDYYIAHFAAGG